MSNFLNPFTNHVLSTFSPSDIAALILELSMKLSERYEGNKCPENFTYLAMLNCGQVEMKTLLGNPLKTVEMSVTTLMEQPTLAQFFKDVIYNYYKLKPNKRELEEFITHLIEVSDSQKF